MTPETLLAVLNIVVIDLTLSGDNALVIGMAAYRLEPRQRRLAIVLGTFGAIGLRVAFAALAAVMLRIPFLQLVGGLVLVWIAYKLLRDAGGATELEHAQGASLLDAVKIIVLADVVMSLDNILAVGGASHGSIELLLFGLLLSMPIVLFGSSLLAGLMARAVWIVYLGAGVLAWTAAGMIAEDPLLASHLPAWAGLEPALTVAIAVGVLAANYLVGRRRAAALPLDNPEAK